VTALLAGSKMQTDRLPVWRHQASRHDNSDGAKRRLHKPPLFAVTAQKCNNRASRIAIVHFYRKTS
jgi:hypothetical protein